MSTNNGRSARALTSLSLEGQTNEHQQWEECTCTHITIAGGANQQQPKTYRNISKKNEWRGKPAVANDNLKRNKMLVKKQTDSTVEKTLT